MKVRVDLVKKLKGTYGGPTEFWRLAKAAGHDITLRDVQRMCKGDWAEVKYRHVEAFLLILGQELVHRPIERA